MKKIEISITNFVSFLINAKSHTWVGEGKKIRDKDYSRNYFHREGNFEYRDQYFGNLMDGGREIVFFNHLPIWIMCYHGGVLKEYNKQSKYIFTFLRKALSCPPTDFPVRGPSSFINQQFVYKNIYNGNLYFFYGTEKILQGDIEVYQRTYVGGEIRDREYQLILI